MPSLQSRLILGALCAIFLCADAHGESFVNSLMPEPAHLVVHQGDIHLDSSFTVATPRFLNPRLEAGIRRMLQQLESQTGIQMANPTAGDSVPSATLTVEVQGLGERVQSVDEDESYSLDIEPGRMTLRSATVVGALRGMQTLIQLVQRSREGYSLPAVQIEDAPRFRWRGLLVDCGRHFEPVDEIERTLDGMATVKLNVFHWHLTEDQGFRIESRTFPRLTGMGSDGLYYTQAQAREIVAYAQARGIRVVPEFDMPGHSRSWFVGYPQLASGPGPYDIRREFGIEDSAMDPTRESTYMFIDAFLSEMTDIFPDPYLHIGGDESNGAQWKSNPRIAAFMRRHNMRDAAALQTYFNQRLLAIVVKHGKHMVGWDEIFNPGLPKDVVVQSWRGTESLVAAAKLGYQGILSAPYYLNFLQPAEKHYLADPLPAGSDLTADQSKLILGGEACMWGEYIDASSIDSRIWPRLAAIAERFWSPQDIRDVDDMYRRLDITSLRLEALGLTHLTHEDSALRALSGTSDIQALRVFASIVGPADVDHPYAGPHITQLTPLDHFSSAVSPDPPSRYIMQRMVREFLRNPRANSPQEDQLQAFFQAWLRSAPTIQEQIARSPLMKDVAASAVELPPLATTGLQALQYLHSGSSAPAGWKQGRLAALDAAEHLNAPIHFVVTEPLRDLVNAVRESPGQNDAPHL